MMMIATVPFVAVGLLFSLTAEEADLGRKKGKKDAPQDEEAQPTPQDEEVQPTPQDGDASEPKTCFPAEKTSGDNANV